MRERVHCYWAYDKARLLIGVRTGVALCGQRGVLRAQLTCHPGEITCVKCFNARVEQEKNLKYTAPSKVGSKTPSKEDGRNAGPPKRKQTVARVKATRRSDKG